jgi:DNA end-binding protein Ku
MPKLKTPVEEEKVDEEEETDVIPARAVWSGSLSMGLVNIPVRAVPITRDKKISFRMLHKSCSTPITYKRFCEEGDEVPESETVYGYKLGRGKYLIFDKGELSSAKPESSKVIALDRFVNFFLADPHYFERTYLLVPDGSDAAYSLLRKTLEKTGKAAIGKMTMSSKERIVLIHYYQNAIVATTMRYSDEVLDPSLMQEIKDLPEPGEKEMALAKDIADRLTGDLDLSEYHDGYRERIEALISSKLKGEVLHLEKRPKKPAAKSLMEALRETAESLNKNP